MDSIDRTETIAKQDEEYLGVGIWCHICWRFDNMLHNGHQAIVLYKEMRE